MDKEMREVTLKDLFEAGAHFGHKREAWHPAMKRYILAEKSGIHIIDIEKTLELLKKAGEFVKDMASKGAEFLFVGTKQQIKEIIKEEAKRCGAHYVTERWLGGTLTNFETIKKSIANLKEMERMKEEGEYDKLPKKEKVRFDKKLAKLQRILQGIRDMERLPDVVFIADIRREGVALRECQKLEIPVVAIIDTNADPREVQYPIPANDDAIKSVQIITSYIADAIIEGRGLAEKGA